MFADPCDVATHNEEIQRQATLRNRRIYEGDSANDCVECDQAIPEGRRLAVPGVQTCVHCESKYEKRHGRTR